MNEVYTDDHLPEDERKLIQKACSIAEGIGRNRRLKILRCNYELMATRMESLRGEDLLRCLDTIDNLYDQIAELDV